MATSIVEIKVGPITEENEPLSSQYVHTICIEVIPSILHVAFTVTSVTLKVATIPGNRARYVRP